MLPAFELAGEWDHPPCLEECLEIHCSLDTVDGAPIRESVNTFHGTDRHEAC